MNDTPTFRCGWRIQRSHDRLRPDLYQGDVLIRRGEFRVQIPAEFFDAMTDADFAGYITSVCRGAVFEQIQADLDVLARSLVVAFGGDYEVLRSEAPSESDVKAALYRWQKAKRDMQEAGT